jgi:hypothetical protein
MICQRGDCHRASACGIALNIPAMGMPIPEHDPIRVIPLVEFCEVHFTEETGCAAEWLMLRQYQEIVTMACQGKVEPDFARAFITRVEFDSEEWIALKKTSLGRRLSGPEQTGDN